MCVCARVVSCHLHCNTHDVTIYWWAKTMRHLVFDLLLPKRKSPIYVWSFNVCVGWHQICEGWELLFFIFFVCVCERVCACVCRYLFKICLFILSKALFLKILITNAEFLVIKKSPVSGLFLLHVLVSYVSLMMPLGAMRWVSKGCFPKQDIDDV